MNTKHKTRMLPTWLRHTTTVLAIAVGLHGLAPMSFGSPIMSEPISIDDARATDMAVIQQMLEQKVVQHRLKELGFTHEEIQSRMELASNADLHQMAVQSEAMMAGGDGGAGLVAVLVIVLLVLLILRIASNDTMEDADMLVA